jgi:pyridoxal phosphate enzyme (YggS family)
VARASSPAFSGKGFNPRLDDKERFSAFLRVTSCPSWFIVLSMPVADNIALVRERIHAAAKRAGRDPDGVALMAVSKTVPPELIRAAYLAGVRVFGENRVQEFTEKVGALRNLSNAEWHLIGHLQTNKATKAAELFSAVDSIDSLRLAQKLNSAAQQVGKKLGVLIEVNVGGENAKTGVAPESKELEEILKAAPLLGQLEISGLMAIPPLTDDPQEARPYFRKLRDLREEIGRSRLPGVSMNVLSMGMSHDFEIAIEEGSTCVRVGTAIFGERKMV